MIVQTVMATPPGIESVGLQPGDRMLGTTLGIGQPIVNHLAMSLDDRQSCRIAAANVGVEGGVGQDRHVGDDVAAQEPIEERFR